MRTIKIAAIMVVLQILLITSASLAQQHSASGAEGEIKLEKKGRELARIMLAGDGLSDFYETAASDASLLMAIALKVQAGEEPSIAKKDRMQEIFKRSFKSVITQEDLEKLIAEVYAKYFNVEEMDILIKFYQTPTGAKLNKTQTAMLRDFEEHVDTIFKEREQQFTNMFMAELQKESEGVGSGPVERDVKPPPVSIGQTLETLAIVNHTGGSFLIKTLNPDETSNMTDVEISDIRTAVANSPEMISARDRMAELVVGKSVTIHVINIKRFGPNISIVGQVSVDGKDVAETLVREGHAWVASGAKNTSLLAIEKDARTRKVGLWGMPQYQKKNPYHPQE